MWNLRGPQRCRSRRRILRCIGDGVSTRAACHECSGRGCKQEFSGHADSVTVKYPSRIEGKASHAGELLAAIASVIDTTSAEFGANASAMGALVKELHQRRAEAALGGSARARERLMTLIDPGAPFMELSPLAANGMYDDAIHGAGIITGIGRVEGRECMIVCNDSTIKGGTYFPMTVKKHLRAQEIARENRLPCIYLVD